MVPILYFSVVTRGKIITFGHKFLAMAQKAYVITQPGSLLHLSHGKIILSDFSLFCQQLQNIYIIWAVPALVKLRWYYVEYTYEGKLQPSIATLRDTDEARR